MYRISFRGAGKTHILDSSSEFVRKHFVFDDSLCPTVNAMQSQAIEIIRQN